MLQGSQRRRPLRCPVDVAAQERQPAEQRADLAEDLEQVRLGQAGQRSAEKEAQSEAAPLPALVEEEAVRMASEVDAELRRQHGEDNAIDAASEEQQHERRAGGEGVDGKQRVGRLDQKMKSAQPAVGGIADHVVVAEHRLEEAGEPARALPEEIERPPRRVRYCSCVAHHAHAQRPTALEAAAMEPEHELVVLYPAGGIEASGRGELLAPEGSKRAGDEHQRVLPHPRQPPEKAAQILEGLVQLEEAARPARTALGPEHAAGGGKLGPSLEGGADGAQSAGRESRVGGDGDHYLAAGERDRLVERRGLAGVWTAEHYQAGK